MGGRPLAQAALMNEQWGWQLAASEVTGTPCAVLGWSHQGWPSAWGKGGKSRAGKGGAAGHEETGHPGSRGVQEGGYGWEWRGQEPGQNDHSTSWDK